MFKIRPLLKQRNKCNPYRDDVMPHHHDIQPRIKMYLIVGGGGIFGFDWLWLSLALIAGIVSYSGSAYGNRDRFSGSGA